MGDKEEVEVSGKFYFRSLYYPAKFDDGAPQGRGAPGIWL